MHSLSSLSTAYLISRSWSQLLGPYPVDPGSLKRPPG